MSSEMSLLQIKILSLIIICKKAKTQTLLKNIDIKFDRYTNAITKLRCDEYIFITKHRSIKYFIATKKGKDYIKNIELARKVLEHEKR